GARAATPPHHAIKLAGAEPASLPVVMGGTADHAERRLQLATGVNDVAAQPPCGHAGSGFRLGTGADLALDLAQHRIEGPGKAAGVVESFPVRDTADKLTTSAPSPPFPPLSQPPPP